jgi:hypothetical protein
MLTYHGAEDFLGNQSDSEKYAFLKADFLSFYFFAFYFPPCFWFLLLSFSRSLKPLVRLGKSGQVKVRFNDGGHCCPFHLDDPLQTNPTHTWPEFHLFSGFTSG